MRRPFYRPEPSRKMKDGIIGHIDYVEVAPARTGKGIGGALLSATFKQLREGHPKLVAMYLAVLAGNRPAIALYEKSKFVKVLGADQRLELQVEVAASERGKGIGGALLSVTFEYLREAHPKLVAMYLMVFVHSCQALYEKSKFVKVLEKGGHEMEFRRSIRNGIWRLSTGEAVVAEVAYRAYQAGDDFKLLKEVKASECTLRIPVPVLSEWRAELRCDHCLSSILNAESFSHWITSSYMQMRGETAQAFSQTVVAVVVMTIPAASMTKEIEDAIKAKMPDPSRKVKNGVIGEINYVEVAASQRGKGIGNAILSVTFKQLRGGHPKLVAMYLAVFDDNLPAIAL
ncbi:hypothetical protein FOZ60_016482 [Perkinsus olseni]|uniref:N-acetyltransferase domain-containing protein n=1 Tax=Perkinsus olseni TaxID=32597 RepID=A0A7J6N4Y1_PEROL|nr:hypothetical protein FOZ60_016482 [Perkinsus olseni]